MNKVRDAFIKNLLQVYYGAPVRSLKSRPFADREGMYGLFLQVQFKNRVKESLLLKQMEPFRAQAVLERENRAGSPFLPEPLFHLQLINQEHLFLQRLAGIPDEDGGVGQAEDTLLQLLDFLEELSRKSTAPLEKGRAYKPEEATAPGDVEASLIPGPETLGVVKGSPVLWDTSSLALHHSGYALWHVILEEAIPPEEADSLLFRFYEKRGITKERATLCRRLAREECFSDRAMKEKGKKYYRELYGE
ncbi:hypothetical protein JXR74_05300 [Candidatus Mcinerneyibacteriota bacterium]|nr:hypothetical protein [Candidatus Mcinerneyibacteriota bacterium]